MNFRKNLQMLLVLLLFAIFFASCATIIGGKNNTLVFVENGEPKATVYIDGEKIGEAPGKIKVPAKKIQHGSTVTLKAEGYHDKDYLVLRKQHGVYTVADLLLGGIPLIIDYANGNIYQPSPRKFEYVLQKK